MKRVTIQRGYGHIIHSLRDQNFDRVFLISGDCELIAVKAAWYNDNECGELENTIEAIAELRESEDWGEYSYSLIDVERGVFTDEWGRALDGEGSPSWLLIEEIAD